VDAIRRARKIHEIQTLEQANEVKAKLEALNVKLAVRAGDSGRLFGSVTPGDVVEAIKAVDGPLVDKRRVEIGSPIKTTGAHQVTVKLHPEVAAAVSVNVVAA
jgi:large subunit ribosomal protein L9